MKISLLDCAKPCIVACFLLAPAVLGAVTVVPTMDTNVLQAALQGDGLSITSVAIRNGFDGQFGTYAGFTNPPVTIGDGIVLSSGSAGAVGDPPDPNESFPQPSYEIGSGSTPEFNTYGPGNIENFESSRDVAAMEVNFTLPVESSIKFDFVFGSVEYPGYTSAYTDAMLVFLDGTDATNQITFDDFHRPVQVGLSFAGQVETQDQNTTFASPHGLLDELTTTSTVLSAGPHTLRFEVGDVNDELLDSAGFISNLRAEPGTPGTKPTHPVPAPMVASWQCVNGTNVLSLAWTNTGMSCVLENCGTLSGSWTEAETSYATNGSWVCAAVTNSASAQFYRLRKN